MVVDYKCFGAIFIGIVFVRRFMRSESSKYNSRSSSGSHFIGIRMGEKYATFKVKLKPSIIRTRWDLSEQSGKSRVRIIENMNINETMM